LRTREPGLIDPMFSGMGDKLAFRPVYQNGTPEQGLSPTVSPLTPTLLREGIRWGYGGDTVGIRWGDGEPECPIMVQFQAKSTAGA
jgi:hypothetical protein